MFKWHQKIIEQHIWTKPKIRHVQKDNNHLIIYFTALKKSIESDVHLHVYLSVIIHLSTYAICWIYLEVPVYITRKNFYIKSNILSVYYSTYQHKWIYLHQQAKTCSCPSVWRPSLHHWMEGHTGRPWPPAWWTSPQWPAQAPKLPHSLNWPTPTKQQPSKISNQLPKRPTPNKNTRHRLLFPLLVLYTWIHFWNICFQWMIL